MEKKLTLDEIHSFKGKYPKQLWALFMVEMWERFCFYGMRGILTIFMADKMLLALSDKEANLKYGAIQAFVYAFTFVGGIFADKILGFKRSLVFGAILMILGNGLIAFDPKLLFYFGIALSIIGTGFFKPNISSMVGELYTANDLRRDAGFSLFYSGINIGALLGGWICVHLGKHVGWSEAFGVAAIVMVIGLVVFFATKKMLGPIGDNPLIEKGVPVKKVRMQEMMVITGALICIPLIYLMINNTNYTNIFMYTVGPLALIYFFMEMLKEKEAGVRKKLIAALLLILFYIIFCAIFEQAGGSLALFAQYNLSDKLLFFHIDPNIINNSANSLFVIILSPILGIIWLAMAKKNKEPHTAIKFGLSFVFLAVAYYLYFSCRFFTNAQGKSSLDLFTFAYFVVTLSELCLSPIGLSMITKLSPKRLSGMMMGLWFLASAYGQYAAGLIGAGMSDDDPNKKVTLLERLLNYTAGYKELALYSVGAALLMFILYPIIKKLMQEVK